jgi:hypothetical protein
MDIALHDLLETQEGTISRRQFLAIGGGDAALRRLVRRKDLVVAHRGVYLNHTGPMTWRQRVWVAHLACPGSALAGRTVLAWCGFTDGPSVIELAVEHGTTPTPPPGVKVRQVRGLLSRCHNDVEPTRLRFEEALVDVAADASTRYDALRLVMDAVQARRTTVSRLAESLRRRPVRHGGWLLRALEDVASGTYSILERNYLNKVERAHVLPPGVRQSRASDSRVRFRDVEYVEEGVIVELDGLAGHTSATERWSDMQRDLHAAASGKTTIRLGWRQVDADACRTAALVGTVLNKRGWTGQPQPCGPGCLLGCPSVKSFAATM